MPRFLSTLSLRRATRLQSRTYQAKDDFYPRSPCGERQGVSTMDNGVTQISIHALLAESDETIPGTQTGTGKFLSTLSLRRATPRLPCPLTSPTVFLSTLSLRRATIQGNADYNVMIFLSTLSLRRATWLTSFPSSPTRISIHALLAESDRVLLP